jgi:hypothetical protein
VGGAAGEGLRRLFTRFAPVGTPKVESSKMDGNDRLRHLAVMASNEQDLDNFTVLAREINLILEEKQERLGRSRIPSKPSE